VDAQKRVPTEIGVWYTGAKDHLRLHDKRQMYARNGVQEYLALQIYEQRVDWFILREGVYAALAPDADGLLRSEVFPGLRFDPAAFWRDNLAALLAAVQRGIATPEHAAFVGRLRGARLPDEEV